MLDGEQTNHIHHTLEEKTMPRTPFGKTRPVDNPYAIYTNSQGWEWRILKTYQHPEKELTNQYSRWFVAARSPMTHGSWEYGDTYNNDILQYGELVMSEDEWTKNYD
tara:strand:- start:471 stop:791 length:321 start_codon:yes stop_codon:yes gene_type:complete